MNNLKFNPILKQLLINYELCMNEEYADTSDDALWMTYNYLKKTNQLEVLFEQEYLDSPLHWTELPFTYNRFLPY